MKSRATTKAEPNQHVMSCHPFAMSRHGLADTAQQAKKTHLFLSNDQVTEFAFPTRQRIRELLIILARSFPVSSTLANLQLEQKLAHHLCTEGKNPLTIDLFVKQEPASVSTIMEV